jgi:RNA polymerase sigma-70 factor, ECF subfamily
MDSFRPVGLPPPDGAPEGTPSDDKMGTRKRTADSQHLAELMRASAKGDEGAFASLYDATSARAFGLAVRVVRDRAQAEEVTQEAYLEVWRTASRFDASRGSALSWVLTILHRKAVDRVRSAEASTRRDTTYNQQNQITEHDSTAEHAYASLEAKRVRGVMRTLTGKQREAIELAYFGGYTQSEVAALLGIPIGTTKTRIRDGLIRMRDALGVGEAVTE